MEQPVNQQRQITKTNKKSSSLIMQWELLGYNLTNRAIKYEHDYAYYHTSSFQGNTWNNYRLHEIKFINYSEFEVDVYDWNIIGGRLIDNSTLLRGSSSVTTIKKYLFNDFKIIPNSYTPFKDIQGTVMIRFKEINKSYVFGFSYPFNGESHLERHRLYLSETDQNTDAFKQIAQCDHREKRKNNIRVYMKSAEILKKYDEKRTIEMTNAKGRLHTIVELFEDGKTLEEKDYGSNWKEYMKS